MNTTISVSLDVDLAKMVLARADGNVSKYIRDILEKQLEEKTEDMTNDA